MYRIQQGTEGVEGDSTEDMEDLGDVRETLDMEYVVSIAWSGSTPYIVGGKHSAQMLDMIALTQHPSSPVKWSPRLEDRIRLDGGHGEEIVRGIYVQGDADAAVFTCGEDGVIRLWKPEGGMEDDAMVLDLEDEVDGKRKKDKGKRVRSKEGRYKPY